MNSARKTLLMVALAAGSGCRGSTACSRRASPGAAITAIAMITTGTDRARARRHR